MERSIFAALVGGLLGISALGGLAFVGSVPGSPAAPPSRPEGEWRLLDPVTYENISVFPVVSSQSQDTSPFLTLEEGLATGEVTVAEQGAQILQRSRDGRPIYFPQPTGASVNQLVLINRSKRPLLLLAGELVSGGKQDRVIGKDRIVPVGAPPLPLDVFCVEHGRWTGSSQFAAAKTIVHPSVRERAAVDQKQTEVWDAVRSGTTAKAAPAAPPAQISTHSIQGAIAGNAGRTEAYEKIYESQAIGVSIDDFVNEVQRRFAQATSGLKNERVVGVVVAYGGEVAWSDIFASGDLFDHYWRKLLRSYAVEALTRPTYRQAASRDNANEFLRRLNGRETQETEPGVYRWREIKEGQLAQIELDALQPRPITLHRLLLHRTS
jgi:hypothetical protein